jgi:hypothetical protein
LFQATSLLSTPLFSELPIVGYALQSDGRNMQARYEAGLMETESHLDRGAVISDVQQLLVGIASVTGLAINE